MGPKGINWIQAFEFYCETIEGRLPSYQDVADKFKVSKTEVGRRALDNNWTILRQELYENGKNKFLENKTNLIAKAENSQLSYWRKIQSLLDTLIEELEANLSLNRITKLSSLTRIMKVSIEGERTVLGLPNTVIARRLEPPKLSTPELSLDLIQEIDKLFETNSSNNLTVN